MLPCRLTLSLGLSFSIELGDHLGSIWGYCWEHVDIILGAFGDNFGSTWGASRTKEITYFVALLACLSTCLLAGVLGNQQSGCHTVSTMVLGCQRDGFLGVPYKGWDTTVLSASPGLAQASPYEAVFLRIHN